MLVQRQTAKHLCCLDSCVGDQHRTPPQGLFDSHLLSDVRRKFKSAQQQYIVDTMCLFCNRIRHFGGVWHVSLAEIVCIVYYSTDKLTSTSFHFICTNIQQLIILQHIFIHKSPSKLIKKLQWDHSLLQLHIHHFIWQNICFYIHPVLSYCTASCNVMYTVCMIMYWMSVKFRV